MDTEARASWSKLPVPELSCVKMGGPPFFPSPLPFVFTMQMQIVPISWAFGGDDNRRVAHRKYFTTIEIVKN